LALPLNSLPNDEDGQVEVSLQETNEQAKAQQQKFVLKHEKIMLEREKEPSGRLR
jgi:hypothetical protein